MPIIEIDSAFGKELGFTSDKFEKCSYLWKKRKEIWISFIMSKESHRGYLRLLFDTIESKGYKIVVPTPFPRMELICMQRGMIKETRFDNNIKEFIEIMIKS